MAFNWVLLLSPTRPLSVWNTWYREINFTSLLKRLVSGNGEGRVTISPSQEFSVSRKSVRCFKVGNLEMQLRLSLRQVYSLVTRRTVKPLYWKAALVCLLRVRPPSAAIYQSARWLIKWTFWISGSATVLPCLSRLTDFLVIYYRVLQYLSLQ